MSESEIKAKLQHVQSLIANLSANMRKAEAIRDSLLRQLLDNTGAHDQRPVAVR